MNTLKAQNIAGLELLSDKDLHEVLSGLEPHPVGNVNWQEYPYKPSVNFRIAHSDKALAILFEVEEEHTKAAAMEGNGPVWEDSCVEFFVAAPDGMHYTNFEMNCAGTLLAARRKSRNEADMFSSAQLDDVRRINSLPHEPIDAHDLSWWAIEVIPFEAMGYKEKPSSIRANFYKCGDKCEKPHFLSWSPIDLPQPDFHCPDFFGDITLD